MHSKYCALIHIRNDINQHYCIVPQLSGLAFLRSFDYIRITYSKHMNVKQTYLSFNHLFHLSFASTYLRRLSEFCRTQSLILWNSSPFQKVSNTKTTKYSEVTTKVFGHQYGFGVEVDITQCCIMGSFNHFGMISLLFTCYKHALQHLT